jgi:hypothetical protein
MRLWVNTWMVVGAPLWFVSLALAVAMFSHSTDPGGYLASTFWLLVVALLTRIVLGYALVTTPRGLSWVGGHADWQAIDGFIVREWRAGLVSQHVVVAVCADRSVVLRATMRFQHANTERLKVELEKEKQDHM